MKRSFAVAALTLAALLVVLTIGHGQRRIATPQKSGLSSEARKAIETVGDDMAKLVASHDQYVLKSREAEALTGKLLQSIREVTKLAAGSGQGGSADKKLLQAIKDLGEMSQSFNMQYLGLQQQMQDENRRFTLISNIMKTKHDTAKNAIDNIR